MSGRFALAVAVKAGTSISEVVNNIMNSLEGGEVTIIIFTDDLKCGEMLVESLASYSWNVRVVYAKSREWQVVM